MSSNKENKNGFRIEAFACKEVVDPEFPDKAWESLEQGINQIYTHNIATGINFEELYRNAYSMVLHKFGDKLYTGLVSTMTYHVKAMSSVIENTQGDRLFLEELNDKWTHHNKATEMIRDILMYMDRTYVPSTRKTPVHELGMNLWRDNVICSSSIQTRLLNALFELKRKERVGEVINRGLMRNIIKMLRDLGPSVYQGDFEKLIHDVSSEFDKVESQESRERCDCGDDLRNS